MKLILNSILIVALIFAPFQALGAVTEPDRSMVEKYREILKNNGFENGKVGWTASGGTFAVNAASKHTGNQGASWDSSGAGQTLKSDYAALSSANNNEGLKGQNGVAYCKMKGVSSVATTTIKAVDGNGTELAQAITPSASTAGFQTVRIANFVFPNSGNSTTDRVAIWLTSVAANEPELKIDDCSFRLADNVAEVKQSYLVGTVKVTGCTGTWTRSSSTFGSLSTQTSCVYAVTGQLTAPATMIAGFRHPDLGAGVYTIEYEGGIYNASGTNVSHARFHDGTNATLEDSSWYSSAGALISPSIKHTITYTSTKAAGTIEMQVKNDSGVATDVYGTNVSPATFRMWYTPTSDQRVINAAAISQPTVQRFLSGSGTYTRPSGVTSIRVRMVGGGGGGSCRGVSGTCTGGTGGTTTFGSSLLTATGGVGGTTGQNTGVGGTATVNSPAISVASLSGGSGTGGVNVGAGANVLSAGGVGGNSFFGGAGGGTANTVVGLSAAVNSGSGGGGEGNSSTVNHYGGSGGGAGAYIEANIVNPSLTYSYAVGAAGTAGGNGGAGGSGVIIVEETYGFNAPVFINNAKALRYTSTSGQAVNNATLTTIIYGTLDYNTLDSYNPATGVFTATQAGLYRIHCAAVIPTLGSSNINNYIYKNGAVYARQDWDMPTATTTTFDIETETRLSIGDTLDCRMQHNAASDALSTSVGANYITISRIGE